MAELTKLTTQIYIKVDGQRLTKEVFGLLAEARVDQHTHLPGVFTLRFFDPELKLLNRGAFDLVKAVEISAETVDGRKVVLIRGTIETLESEFRAGMNAELVARGYDKLRGLHRATRTKTYLNVKDSDLAEEVARAAGLKVETTPTRIIYDHIYQHNQSDLAFLNQRAWRIGYECFVEGETLYFRRPSAQNAEVALTWGQDLLSFSSRITLAEQVKEVVVKGWDIEKQATIVGRADKGILYPDVEAIKNTDNWMKELGAGKVVIVDQAVVSQAEADILAAARLDEISGAFIEAEGVAIRRPDIIAGKAVKLLGLGERLSGVYLVTSATHIYTADGMKTRFSVRGIRTGLLTEQILHQPALDRWPGVVPAVVTNTDDPKDWGRVKVAFPWMSEQEESDWARVVSAGAGPDAGFYAIPAVNDEVLVAFVHGDFSQPVILGGLWNGQHNVPPETKEVRQGERPLVREWRSRSGHRIVMYDNGDDSLEIVTKDGLRVQLDDTKKSILIKASGDIIIDAEGDLQLSAGRNVSVSGEGDVTVTGKGGVRVIGSTINFSK